MGSREFDSMHYSDEGRALEPTFLIGWLEGGMLIILI